ncbi:MAG: hypothetical protein WA810_02875 [Maribacter sp.]
MKLICVSLLGFLCFVSCTAPVDQEKLHLLNGYWEIKEVVLSDGTKKEYKINGTVDFILLDSLKGFRKKVDPKFNGTFETSDDAEQFSIEMRADSIFMHYGTPMNSWKEVLVSLDDEGFAVKNEQGIIYRYQRFEPLNITP